MEEKTEEPKKLMEKALKATLGDSSASTLVRVE